MKSLESLTLQENIKKIQQYAKSDQLSCCNCTIKHDCFRNLSSNYNNFILLLRESLLKKCIEFLLNTMIKLFPFVLSHEVDSFLSRYHLVVKTFSVDNSGFINCPCKCHINVLLLSYLSLKCFFYEFETIVAYRVIVVAHAIFISTFHRNFP